MQRSDDTESHIRERLGGRIRNLRVTVQDGGVVLQGRVATFYAKQLAQQAAMESGVSVLTNQIEVL